jgi:hypothetical protein
MSGPFGRHPVAGKTTATILAFLGGATCFLMAVNLPTSSSGVAISAVAVVLGACGVAQGGLTFQKPRMAGVVGIPLGCLCIGQAIATMLLHTRSSGWMSGRSPGYFYLASAVLILAAAAIALSETRHPRRPTSTGEALLRR